MSENNLTGWELYSQFESKYAAMLKKHGKNVIGWQEIQTSPHTSPDPESTIVEVWEGNDALASTVADGFQSIVSSNWYACLCALPLCVRSMHGTSQAYAVGCACFNVCCL